MIGAHLLPQQVTYTPYLGEGAYGPVYGDPVTVRARVNYERKLVRTATGTEVTSAATVYLAPGATLSTGDTVTMPDGGTRQVIAVAPHVGQRDVEVVEVDVG